MIAWGYQRWSIWESKQGWWAAAAAVFYSFIWWSAMAMTRPATWSRRRPMIPSAGRPPGSHRRAVQRQGTLAWSASTLASQAKPTTAPSCVLGSFSLSLFRRVSSRFLSQNSGTCRPVAGRAAPAVREWLGTTCMSALSSLLWRRRVGQPGRPARLLAPVVSSIMAPLFWSDVRRRRRACPFRQASQGVRYCRLQLATGSALQLSVCRVSDFGSEAGSCSVWGDLCVART
jgi:hypothetical protein